MTHSSLYLYEKIYALIKAEDLLKLGGVFLKYTIFDIVNKTI